MINFSTTIEKFEKKGDKTGWTYFKISSAQANNLNPKQKKSYRVKGKLDSLSIKAIAILPMGDGSFIFPFNADFRKKTGKKKGDKINVMLKIDTSVFQMNTDFIECLKDDQKAYTYFKTLTESHQRYFSKWIETAKTDNTKAKRIGLAIKALSMKWGYPEMIRYGKSITVF